MGIFPKQMRNEISLQRKMKMLLICRMRKARTCRRPIIYTIDIVEILGELCARTSKMCGVIVSDI